MRPLSKYLMVLFIIISTIIVLITAVTVKLALKVILIRLLIGGFIFGLIGVLIGQILDSSLKESNSGDGNDKKDMECSCCSKGDDGIKASSSIMTPLQFEKVDKNEGSIFNEDSSKVAEVIRNIE